MNTKIGWKTFKVYNNGRESKLLPINGDLACLFLEEKWQYSKKNWNKPFSDCGPFTLFKTREAARYLKRAIDTTEPISIKKIEYEPTEARFVYFNGPLRLPESDKYTLARRNGSLIRKESDIELTWKFRIIGNG